MTLRTRPVARPRRTPVLTATGLILALSLVPGPSTAQESSGCDLCHGEVELLRQHTTSLAEARRLTVTADGVANSAHGDEPCASCHTGFRRWPHDPEATTETCVSCHEEEAEPWSGSLHAEPRLAELAPADCAACHTVHDVRSTEDLRTNDGVRTMNATCVSCHETQALEPHQVHGDTVSCGGCHAPHRTLQVDDERAAVAPHRQVDTCGACHEEAADAFRTDAHGSALAEEPVLSLPSLTLRGAEVPPTCTSCHQGHGMLAVDDTAALVLHVESCAACHADEADRYFGTYHGKATALGSRVVASCDDCHGAHGIFPSGEEASWVHETRLVETCGECHEHARPAFVAYDSHPDPLDPDRNRPLFLSFVFMNTLLIGVLVVFGLHTLLWWVRILLDRRRSGEEAASHG